ncbi:protein FAR1-RELATED SEQUENCE 5-like [Daucus carota subsp. sativus]|uniref:protein FAR1-RELATED SEQUENCE 5-like n=1 Tax=Daucus carota subsp. sativus TaxID=79200 RepID=UPI0030832E9A
MITLDLAKISDNQGLTCGDCSRVGAVDVSDVVVSDECDSSITNYTLSPGGQKYYLPSSVDLVEMPFANQVFDSLDKAFKFYKEYGRLGVKKGYNVANFGSEKKVGKFVKERRTGSHRCGCKEKIVVKIMSLNRYFIMNFVESHNHPLASEDGRQFLRCSRDMSISLWNMVFDASKVNIGCSKAYSLVKEMAGGYSNVGATLRDFRNFSRDLKEYVGERDDGYLTMLFWADATGRRNFEIYGDAVSFDATFDTNKYNMIFAPFTGVDKHDRCVTFAACLFAKENVTHFSWAFRHFVKAMGRNLVVLITDQCSAMKIAIPDCFSSENGLVASKHRLCMWHIMQKFPIKLGNRLCKETDFMEKMKAYIWSSILEIEEFENGWKSVIKEFNLEENKWLSDMYEMRASWIPSYFRDSPMFGLLRTTSRSESENFFFGHFHRQSDTFPSTLSRWFIENDAAEIFTRAIFYKLQEEIIASCLEMQIKKMSEDVNGVIHLEIRDVKVKDKIFKVSVSKAHAVCSCKKFVMCGIVCRHAFCGLKQIGVTKFPKSLVLNRWMKIADCGSGSNVDLVTNDYFKMERVSLKLSNIWFDFRQTVNNVGVDLEKLEYVHKAIKEINAELEKYGGDAAEFSKKDHIASIVGEQPVGELNILVPNISKNKGNHFKRLISDREKALNKSKKRIRRCKECSMTTHDSRTCPKKKGGMETNVC